MERQIIACLVDFMKQQNKNSLIMNTLKTLRKISAKTKIRLSALNGSGLGSVMKQLLLDKISDDSICFSILNVISNIASDSDESREHLLNSGILEPIIK
jgi:phosphoenolpyruvate carboxylase